MPLLVVSLAAREKESRAHLFHISPKGTPERGALSQFARAARGRRRTNAFRADRANMGLVVSCCMPGGNPDNLSFGQAMNRGMNGGAKPVGMAARNANAQMSAAYRKQNSRFPAFG